MITVHKHIGRKLEYIRKQRHLTQAQFGQLLGMKQNTYSGFESGKRLPDLDKVMLFAEKLDEPWQRFVEGL